MVKVGDIVRRIPTLESGPERDIDPYRTGVVIFVHSKGRFHVVEFQALKGAYRESFRGVE